MCFLWTKTIGISVFHFVLLNVRTSNNKQHKSEPKFCTKVYNCGYGGVWRCIKVYLFFNFIAVDVYEVESEEEIKQEIPIYEGKVKQHHERVASQTLWRWAFRALLQSISTLLFSFFSSYPSFRCFLHVLGGFEFL